VVMLQELHGVEGDRETLERAFPQCLALTSFGEWGGRGGVAILIWKSLLSSFGSHTSDVISLGRCLELQLCSTAGNLHLINIHIDPNLSNQEKLALLAQVLGRCPYRNDTLHVLGGDLNFESKDSHRLDLVAGKEVVSYSAVATYFYNHAVDFIDVCQPNYTRVAKEEGVAISAHWTTSLCRATPLR